LSFIVQSSIKKLYSGNHGDYIGLQTLYKNKYVVCYSHPHVSATSMETSLWDLRTVLSFTQVL